MNSEFMLRTLIVLSLMVLPGAAAAENSAEEAGCKPYSTKKLNELRGGRNVGLMMGAGLIGLIDPVSGINREFLEMAGNIENPKGAAVFSMINYELERPWIELPLTPSLRNNIAAFMTGNDNNALAYYLDALAQEETAGDRAALEQIKTGNAKPFNNYAKQRFEAVFDAGVTAGCSKTQARQYAFSRFFATNTYSRLRRLCRKLVHNIGPEARTVCFQMGSNMERSSLTLVEQVVSLTVQSNALEDSPADVDALIEIEKKKEGIRAVGERTVDIAKAAVPEDVHVRYYETLLKSGETAAREYLTEQVNRKTP
jgi:hypothetical protein